MAEQTYDWDDTPDLTNQTLAYFTRGVKTFWTLIATERKAILTTLALLILCQTLGLASPLLFSELLDYLPHVVRDGVGPRVYLLAGSMLVAVGTMLVVRRFVWEPLFLRSIIRLENYWPQLAQKKLLALSVGYHERENTGKKIAKVNKGVEKLVGMLGDLFWALLPALFYLVINGIIILVRDWRLGLILLLPFIPAIWFYLQSYKLFFPMWEEWECAKEKAVGYFCQSILNIRTVQAFVAEKREEEMHGDVRERMRSMDTSVSVRMQRYFFGMEATLQVAFIGTLLLGFFFVYWGWSTVGTVAYIAITGNATIQSVWSIIHVYTRMMRDLVAAERMHALLLEDVDVANTATGVVPAHVRGTLAFEHVTHTYPGRQEPVLRDFNLEIAPGEMLAFVGRSGSGKTTAANLLLRTLDPSSGGITIDGVDARSVDRDWYRKRFAHVQQDVEVLECSIRENIAYGVPGASEEAVLRAVEAACLSDVLSDRKRFPDGLDTEVGERGVRLSGGERQRVGIARAYLALLAGDAKVLVLDEATASLDSESERVVQRFIGELRKQRGVTIVAIAHRLSTIREADRICVLDSGVISEIGTHDELLRENGLYHRLVQLQTLGELRE